MADAEAAARLLMATPGVDAHRVVLVGHSLGAALAPLIATHAAGLAGLLLLAAPSRPPQDYLVPQTRYLLSLQGPLTATGIAQLQRLQSEVAQVNSPSLSAATPSSRLPFSLPPGYWLYLRDYRGPQAAARLRQVRGRDRCYVAGGKRGWFSFAGMGCSPGASALVSCSHGAGRLRCHLRGRAGHPA